MKLFTISVFHARWVQHTFDFLFPSLSGLMLGAMMGMAAGGVSDKCYVIAMLCLVGIIFVLAIAIGKWLAEKEER